MEKKRSQQLGIDNLWLYVCRSFLFLYVYVHARAQELLNHRLTHTYKPPYPCNDDINAIYGFVATH